MSSIRKDKAPQKVCPQDGDNFFFPTNWWKFAGKYTLRCPGVSGSCSQAHELASGRSPVPAPLLKAPQLKLTN